MGPLMGTNKAAWGVKLLLTTVWSYQVDCGGFCACPTEHSTAVCLPVDGFPRLRLPTHPQRPPPINFIRDITGVVKKPPQKPAVLAR